MDAETGMDKIIYQIEESKVGALHHAFCPELVMTGFGDSPEEARESLRREIGLYLEDCEGLGILDEVLIEAGFYDNDHVWMSSLVEPPREPKITFMGRP
jgi:hypothetical protein